MAASGGREDLSGTGADHQPGQHAHRWHLQCGACVPDTGLSFDDALYSAGPAWHPCLHDQTSLPSLPKTVSAHANVHQHYLKGVY